jgi:hypothetical protein
MPLKRITPSFTVEYRQAKRPNAGSVKPGWAHAKPPPAGVDEKAIRIAIPAFKTVAAHPPADVVSPSILPGRILASLVEAEPATRLPAAGGAQSRSYGVAADGAVTRELGERIYSGNSCDLSVAGVPVEAAGDLGSECYEDGDAKIGETDPASCRKAREVRSHL